MRGEDLTGIPRSAVYLETPPPAWGRLVLANQPWHDLGNTPTSVGKMSVGLQSAGWQQKHPHEHGEDHLYSVPTLYPSRKTPTGVGKSAQMAIIGGLRQKHPHDRGEDMALLIAAAAYVETPPRLWGRPALDVDRPEVVRNTPTPVGKTTEKGDTLIFGSETPPRPRGRLWPG